MRVVIADDSGIFRQGLHLLLDAASVDVVDEVGTVPQLLRAVAEHRPDACIVDVRMPPTHTDEGIKAALQLRATYQSTGVLVLSTYADAALAEQLLSDGAGGVGYLLKDRVDDVAGLLDGLRRVADGGTVIDTDIVTAVVQRRRRHGPFDDLTERERAVLAGMARGLSNAGIARELHLSVKTIESHVASIFAVLGLHADPKGHENRRVRAVLEFLRQ